MKIRLDQILLDMKIFENRNKARAYIIDGCILVNKEKIIKAGTMFDPTKIIIEVIKKENDYVSRAGKKLEKSLLFWNIDLKNKTCLDIGSSTGGFTDCCLKFNANFVYAVDVGTNQLDWKLRNNVKVKSMEKTNFRNVNKSYFDKKIDFFCCDVSFISVEKILEPLSKVVDFEIEGIILIKPQFESDKEDVKNGKINSKLGHKKSIERVIGFCNKNGFEVLDINYSPILGNKKKNIEYLCWIKKKKKVNNLFDISKTDLIIDECWNYFRDLENERK
ncbi:rRNA methyltransferase [Spiroplasma helicoides]|uniref:rRNA methyltransferase n=1 Tax=Spiroplasma helicoides TaxID=216938 RepID=A0A1B3SKR9_9MOLU|nr:TlyA family RNA methyltransferase [Spiroplasma helicoides]AOG60515.1 rRNA methyltransferase [Spiroplasma helicoides]